MTKLTTNLTLLLGFLCMLPFTAINAQGTYTLKDSVNIRDKHKMRQWSYENNLIAFPPPKKNNWSLGLQGGTSFISGDVSAKPGYGFGLNVRKALGHTVSLRGQLTTGRTQGLNTNRAGGFLKNRALNGVNDPNADYTVPGTYSFVYYNYRMSYTDLNLQGVINLNNINFYKQDPKVSIYGFGGFGGMIYRTMVDALDENGNIYDYSGVPTENEAESKQDIRNSLENLLDGEYETEAESHSGSTLFERQFVPSVTVGAGMSVKLSRRVDLALEHRVAWTGDDLLDGQRWEETLTLTANSDYHQYTSLGINFRIGKGEESMWFSNPLSGPMNDIRTLKTYHAKADKDSDNDGVPDSRDKESGTPEGAIVDVKGRAIDSDMDGIQDFRDKEPFSPKGAQVDRSGIALDSDGDGVPDIFDEEINSAEGAFTDSRGRTIEAAGEVGISEEDADLLMPMVNFDLGKSDIKQEFYPSLYYIARVMMQRPDVRIKVIGHTDTRGSAEKNEALAEARCDAVISFLTGNFGISKDRFEKVGKGESNPLIKDLPTKAVKPKVEGFHYLNRRVEFEIIEL